MDKVVAYTTTSKGENMEPKEVMSVATMSEFHDIMSKLNLTDRQKKVFEMKYSRGLRHVDIAEELDVHQDTITADMKVIREKLKKFSLDNREKT